MSHNYLLLFFWVIAVVAIGIWAASGFFSRDARLERRRRKSHSRIASKTNRPSVQFSVKPPKE